MLNDNKVMEFLVSIAALPTNIRGRAAWLKEQFDARSEQLRVAYNGLIDDLQKDGTAAEIGAQVPAELPVGTPKTVQGVLGALLAWAVEKLGLKADKADTYTKTETNAAINNKVVEIGSGDMAQAEYGGSAPGVVAQADQASEADNAAALGQRGPAYYREAIYTGTFLLDGWVAAEDGLSWTQTVPVTQDEGPALAPGTELLGPLFRPTEVWATNEILAEVQRIVHEGINTPGEGVLISTVKELPEADAALSWKGKVMAL